MALSRHAITAEPEYFYLQHVASGLFLTPVDARTDPGIPVEGYIYAPEVAEDTQLWTLTADGRILNRRTRLVLEVADARALPGGHIVQRPAEDSGGDRTRQLWAPTPDGRIRSRLQSPTGEPLVLGLRGVTSKSWATLEFETDVAEPRQCWRMVRSAVPRPTRFFIEHVRTGALLTPEGGRPESGTPLAVEPGELSHPETKLWSWSGEGYLVNDAAPLVADVKGGAVSDGEVILWPGKGGEDTADNQKWIYTRDGRMRSGLGDDRVLAPAGGSGEGRPVHLVRSTGSPDERWRVRRAVFPEPTSLARAVHLNGSTQAVSLTDPGPALDAFTAEAWVRTSTGGPVITSRGTTTDTTGLALAIGADGALVFQVAGGPAVDGRPLVASVTTGPTTATDGEWHHLAGTRDGNTLTVYLDGVPVEPVDRSVHVAPLGTPPRQRLQFGVIRSGSGITHRDWLDGDLAEIRLWGRARTAAEIPTTMHHRVDDTDPDLLGRWAFAADDGRDSGLGHRHATLIGGPAFLDSDVEIVPRGDFYLVTQARLIQDYLHDPQGAGGATEIEGYRVTLNIRDGDDQPAAGFITVALNNPAVTPSATLHFPDGTSTTLTGERPQATLTTDARGVVTFTMDADGRLTCPMLRAQADFMTDGSWLVIAPDRQAHAALAGITGNALRGRDADGNTIEDKSAPLPAHVDAATADATARAIAQVMSTAVQHNAQADEAQIHLLSRLQGPRVRLYWPRYNHPGFVASGHDGVSDAISAYHIDRDAPVARLLTPENAEHSHWTFDFTTFTPHTPEQAAREIRNLASLTADGDLAPTLLPHFGPGHITGETVHRISSARYNRVAEHDIMATTGVPGWFKEHVAKAARILVNTVETTIIDEATQLEQKVKTLVITAVDAMEHATYAVIQAVEHAVDVVAGFLEKVGGDIKAVVTFLKDLFRWKDVVNTHRILHAYARNLKPFVIEVVHSAADLAGKDLLRLKDVVDREIEGWRRDLRTAGVQSQVNSTAAGPPQDVRTSYVTNLASANAAAASVPAALDGDLLDRLCQELGDRWVDSLKGAWDDVIDVFNDSPAGSIHSVQSFFVNGVDVILQSLQALLDATLEGLHGLVQTMGDMIEAMLGALFDAADTRIDIPVVTSFYEHVVMKDTGEKFSVLGLACLIGAMAGTFAYKLATGDSEGPFSATEADEFCRLEPSAYTWLVDPFAAAPRAAASAAPIQGDRYNFLITLLALAGSTVDALGSVPSDVRELEFPGPWEMPLRINRYKIFNKFKLVGTLLGLLSQIATVTQMARDRQASDVERGIAVAGIIASVVEQFSHAILTRRKTPDWNRADLGVTTAFGCVAVALGAIYYGLSEERNTAEHILTLLNAIFAGVHNIFQLSRWSTVGSPYVASSTVTFLVIGVSDGVGYAGLLGTELGLVVVYAKKFGKSARALGRTRVLTPA